MSWRGSQAASRSRYLDKFDATEAARWVSTLAPADEEAYLQDLAGVFTFRPGMSVLDVGAGAGTLCRILARLKGLQLTALEPAVTMLATFDGQPELRSVARVEGFCDHACDRPLFPADHFDVIASKQLLNGLYDPFAAFKNWHHWLKPDGALVVIDGLYGRDAWQGQWAEEVDQLPLSACESTALAPYLLELAGFRVQAVARLAASNARPATRSERYVVIAYKA